ncbi:T9SS type A sorting domain-containing protein, partial [Vibrio parahaemolyticus]
DLLHVSNALAHFHLTVCDMAGKEMMSTDDSDMVDIRSLAAGVYVVRLTDANNRSRVARVVKN